MQHAAMKSVSQAHHGTPRNRSSTLPSRGGRRRWWWRATHSSWPIAGDVTGGFWPSGPIGSCGVESLTSDFLDVGPPEESLRPEDHERDQDREDDEVGPAGARRTWPVTGRVGLGEAENQPARHCAGDGADAADHGGG